VRQLVAGRPARPASLGTADRICQRDNNQ